MHRVSRTIRTWFKRLKALVEAGMSGVVYCGSMGDWPLLEHHQRQEGVQKLAQAGIPVVVGTGAQNTRLAVEHARHAAEVGAVGLMMIPRLLSRVPALRPRGIIWGDLIRCARLAGSDLQ